MKTAIEIIDQKKFEASQIDEVLTDGMFALHGTLVIKFHNKADKVISGQHGQNDYLKEYGFIFQLIY